MLPTGHIAAGYLTGIALLKISHASFSAEQTNQLLWIAVFFGFAPDVDVFYVFFKTSSMLVCGDEKENHRQYFTHAPLLWLIAGLVVYFFAHSEFYQFVGLLIWLGSWSHFILDSIEDGVMWFWPLTSKVYALKSSGERKIIQERNFFKHSWQFLKFYSRRVTFYIEVLIIIISIVVFLNH